MRFINATLVLTLITAAAASGLSGRHHEEGEADPHANSTMSMSDGASMAHSGSMTHAMPSASSVSSAVAAASSSISAAAAAASSSSAAGFPIARPGALTGALALVVAMVV